MGLIFEDQNGLTRKDLMLHTAFIIAFIVYFIKATTWKGMIFHGLIEKLSWMPKKTEKTAF